jgi:hypothetical protein
VSKLKAIWDGEPVVWISGLIVALGSLAGVHWTDGQVQAVIVALVPIVGAVITRTKTTPAVNPSVPTTIAVRQTNGEEHADLPPTSLPPVWTFPSGTRGGKAEE